MYREPSLNPLQSGPSLHLDVSHESGASSPAKGPGMSGPTGTAASAECWVAGLNLLAIRPPCLKALPAALPEHALEAGSATAVRQEEQQTLQLQLELVLSSQPNTPAATPHATSTHGAIIGQSTFPMLLQNAVLELTVLSKRAQLLQQHYSLLQLLLQEHHQQQQVQEQLQQLLVPTSVPQSLTALLQLDVSCPSQPTEQALNCLHLLLTLKTADHGVQLIRQHQQHQQQDGSIDISNTASGSTVAGPRQAAVGLVAGVPLLVLPAVAQQEVQQLLLPAMRQEVQAEQQQQEEDMQQPYEQEYSRHHPILAAADEQIIRQSLQTEWRVWQHYQQLANDIHTVMLLVDMLQNPAAEAAANSIAAAAAAAGQQVLDPSAAAVGLVEGIPVIVNTEVSVLAGAQASAAAAVAAPVGLSSEAALSSIADNLLFPVLLPFLAAHGLHNLLQLLVSCLPQHLQQQWEQQQQERLAVQDEVITAAVERVPADSSQPEAATAAATLEGASLTGPGQAAETDQQEALQFKQQQPQQHVSEGLAANKEGFEQWSSPTEQQQQRHQRPEQQETEEEDIDDKASSKTAAAGSASSTAAGAQQVQSAAAGGVAGPQSVWWYTPLTQFDRAGEGRYLAWKHYTLIHLDYIGALFAVMYLLALLRRMINEPTTLFYFIYVLLKCMPLAPLILGFREPFLRYRELWLWLVIPASILAFFVVKLQFLAAHTTLLPQKALSAYWNGHGELMTSAMRPFIQHMRLRPYMAYTLADAAMCVWVFAQFYGYQAAIWRWGFAAALSISLCWGLDLHMRRKFVALRS